MRSLFGKLLFSSIAFTSFLFSNIYESKAQTANKCSEVVSIKDLYGVLYKPENLHGARGPTLLVQNAIERTKKRRIQIRDRNCKLISTFGLFRTDYPYGARYYQKSGGSNHTARQLYQLSRKARGAGGGILVQGVDKWILIKDPRKREGIIYGD